MNIHNFTEHINKIILERGYFYYEDGNIAESITRGGGEYLFMIHGSDFYEVHVQLNKKGDILRSSCNCPFDYEEICKHQVAAFYELANELQQPSEGAGKKVENLKEVLSALSKEKLISIIEDMTQTDKSLKQSLILTYAKSDSGSDVEHCKVLIKTIKSKYKRRGGFIEYRNASAFANELDEINEKAWETKDAGVALDIAFLLLNEGIGAFQYTDDSGGDIGYLVRHTLNLIREVALASEDLKERQEIFHKILKQCDRKVFDDWDEFKLELLSICVELADEEKTENKLRKKLESLLTPGSNQAISKYGVEEALRLLFELTKKFGTDVEVEEFITNHLQFSYFRELYIQQLVEQKNYHKVIDMALEGEQQDSHLAGLVLKWRQLRYVAYKELGMNEEQRELAKDLMFSGEFKYYEKLKQLNTKNQEDFYINLKQELKQKQGWKAKEIYLELILEENDLDELMDYVRRNPESIETYAPMLTDQYEQEVLEIYKALILSQASSSSDRRKYKAVCKTIKKYKKIAGKERQKEIVVELSQLYPQRPAFLDELSKIR